jgi:hypothetical protein
MYFFFFLVFVAAPLKAVAAPAAPLNAAAAVLKAAVAPAAPLKAAAAPAGPLKAAGRRFNTAGPAASGHAVSSWPAARLHAAGGEDAQHQRWPVVTAEMSSTPAMGDQTAAARGIPATLCGAARLPRAAPRTPRGGGPRKAQDAAAQGPRKAQKQPRKAQDADDLANRQLCHEHDEVELQTGMTSLPPLARRQPAG